MRATDQSRKSGRGADGHDDPALKPIVPGRTRVFVIHPDVRSGQRDGEAQVLRTPEARLEEAVGLAEALDLDVVASGIVPIAKITPATLMGSGKVAELSDIVASQSADLVIVDTALTPVQQRNLEKAWSAKVLDRTGLILEIFAARASTREGRLQVELAQLTYQKSRLVRSWTHLERQRGGLGFVGGPGETQIEADRRMIQERITQLTRDLNQVRRTRSLHRESRAKVPYPVVALVGYTNAGKSTLFNRMTKAKVRAQDLLFATLDPTMRRVELPHGAVVILSDTVGFISDLPTHLVAAFRATLEEVTNADLILHVRDLSHPDSAAQARDVHAVLDILKGEGKGKGASDRAAIIEVLNKVDLLDPAERERLLAANLEPGPAILVSALTGQGIDRLLGEIETALARNSVVSEVTVDAARGRDINWLHEHCEVLDRHDTEDGAVLLTVRVPPARLSQFQRRFGGSPLAA